MATVEMRDDVVSVQGGAPRERLGPPNSDLEITLPAARENLSVVRDSIEPFLTKQLARYGATDVIPDALLALQEAATNVVRHAYGSEVDRGQLRVRAEISPYLLRLTVVDSGPGYDFEAVPKPDVAHPRDGGFGVHLMREAMSRVSYLRRPGRNTLLLEKTLCGGCRERVA